jgi:hypothetical protein
VNLASAIVEVTINDTQPPVNLPTAPCSSWQSTTLRVSTSDAIAGVNTTAKMEPFATAPDGGKELRWTSYYIKVFYCRSELI